MLHLPAKILSEFLGARMRRDLSQRVPCAVTQMKQNAFGVIVSRRQHSPPSPPPTYGQNGDMAEARHKAGAVLLTELPAKRKLIFVPVHALRLPEWRAPFRFTQQEYVIRMYSKIYLGASGHQGVRMGQATP